MSKYLFSYGTLQLGLAPDEIVPSVRQLAEVGKGVVPGTLFDLGDYPGAILDPLSKFEILGTVYQLPLDEEVLRRIDAYEGFYPESPEKSLFLRVVWPVKLDAGMTVSCWIYVYNGAVEGAHIVKDGRFVKVRESEGSKH